MPISSWSTTAADNDNADGAINWAEGQAPSSVNNSARAMMAVLRTQHEDAEWIDHGHTLSYISAVKFTAGATDRSAIYAVGRRLRSSTGLGASTGFVYGEIATVTHSALTTVTITPDSGGSLSNTIIAAAVGILNPANLSIPPLGAESIKAGAIGASELSDSVVSTTTIIDAQVTKAKLASAAVGESNLSNSSVSLAKLSATGVRDGTTFYRGDGTFAVPASTAATRAEMESASNTTVVVTPGRTQFHPGVVKAYGVIINADTTPELQAGSYNVSSTVDDDGTGLVGVNLDITMANTNYTVLVTIEDNPSSPPILAFVPLASLTTTAFQIRQCQGGTSVEKSFVDAYWFFVLGEEA